MEHNLITEEEKRKIKEFKALYYELNARPDTTTKFFTEKVVVKMEDLQSLQNLVQEKLSLHNTEGKAGKSYVSIATSKNKSYNFDDWLLFTSHNWKIPEYIESITLVWDFLISVEGYKNPQRHKLTVKISSGLKPEEFLNLIFSGSVEEMQGLAEAQAPIIAQMDFIENRLGQEFLNIVEEWVNTLEKTEQYKSKVIIFLRKKRKIVAYYLNYLLFLLFCITALIGYNYITISYNITKIFELSIEQLNFMVNYIVICALSGCIILNRASNVANKVFRTLSTYDDEFIFKITSGDEQQYSKIRNIEKKSAFKVICNLIFSLILNIACGIIATVIYTQLTS